MIRSLSSAEIDRDFPFVTRIIIRTDWQVHERLAVNKFLEDLGRCYRGGDFNSIRRYRFAKADRAAAFSEFILTRRLDRLRSKCWEGSSREEVAAEWVRIEQERQAILDWGRQKGRLQDVVQEYRFARRAGDASYKAHEHAALAVARADPSVADPANYAGVLIEWAEKEHREWFWRCCRDHHVL
jgi:hypothetical protein